MVEKATGEAAYEVTPVPACAEHVWATFWELHAQRQGGVDGPCGLQWGEIYAWSQLTSEALRPWEVTAIMRMDKAFLEANAEHKAKA